MSTYELMQLDVGQLKKLIREKEGKEKRRHIGALLLKDVLCVLLAVTFIVGCSVVFGKENSPVGVAIFCLVLSMRFVHYEYCKKDTVLNMGIIFLILTFGTFAASFSKPLLQLVIHVVCLGSIMLMVSDQPRSGNALIYFFSYILLFGNPVTGKALALRAAQMGLGYFLCLLVLHRNHKNGLPKRRFREVLQNYHFSDPDCQWRLRSVLGVSVAMCIGSLLGLERVMWIGITCNAALTAYGTIPHKRMGQRMVGMVAGCVLFVLLCMVCPPELRGFFGIISGLCLGVCARYDWQSMYNAFGGLIAANVLFTATTAIELRVVTNVLGAVLGIVIAFLFAWMFAKCKCSDGMSVKEN